MRSGHFPFVEHVGMRIAESRAGHSRCVIQVGPEHMNSQGSVHGAVLFALADTGMGAALVPALQAGQHCATIEVKIAYFKPVLSGEIVCTSDLVHLGRSIASLESQLLVAGQLVAKASGTFAIRRRAAPEAG